MNNWIDIFKSNIFRFITQNQNQKPKQSSLQAKIEFEMIKGTKFTEFHQFCIFIRVNTILKSIFYEDTLLNLKEADYIK